MVKLRNLIFNWKYFHWLKVKWSVKLSHTTIHFDPNFKQSISCFFDFLVLQLNRSLTWLKRQLCPYININSHYDYQSCWLLSYIQIFDLWLEWQSRRVNRLRIKSNINKMLIFSIDPCSKKISYYKLLMNSLKYLVNPLIKIFNQNKFELFNWVLLHSRKLITLMPNSFFQDNKFVF